MNVRNGMYGQAHRMATGISPAPAPAGRDLCGGGLSDLRRARSGHWSQDTLARMRSPARKTFRRRRRVQSGDQPTGMQLPLRDNTLHEIPPHLQTMQRVWFK
jgi:hypothetical protein